MYEGPPGARLGFEFVLVLRTATCVDKRQVIAISLRVPKLNLLPSGQPLLVHAGIRGLRDRWGLSTGAASEVLVAKLIERKPSHLFVPSFTYSFTKTGDFSRSNSLSEVGGFSEHVRSTRNASLRTLDPIFSCIDVLDTGFSRAGMNDDVFGDRSVWHLWDGLDGLIVNIGLDKVIATQVHYVESRVGVPYRYDKVFPGRVVDDVSSTTTSVLYNYNVRDLDEDPQWDRTRLRAMLKASGVLQSFTWEGVEVLFMRAREVRRVLESALAADPRALLQRNAQ